MKDLELFKADGKRLEEQSKLKVSPAAAALLVACPLLGLLVCLVPWEGDARFWKPVVKYERFDRAGEIFFLANSIGGLSNFFHIHGEEDVSGLLPWHETERKRILSNLDPNEMFRGKPIFVQFGILGSAAKPETLSDFVRRGARIDSTEWGCTALIEALGAQGIEVEKPKDFWHRADPEQPTNAELIVEVLLQNGSQLPDISGLSSNCPESNPGLSRPMREHGILVGVSKVLGVKTAFKLLDHGGSEGEERALSGQIAREWEKWSANELREKAKLIGKSHVPEAVALFEVLLTRVEHSDGRAAQFVLENGLNPNVMLPEGSTPLLMAMEEGFNRWSSEVEQKGVAKAVKLLQNGGDPNKRSRTGRLPIEPLLHRCTSRKLEKVYEECKGERTGYASPCSLYRENVDEARRHEMTLLPVADLLVKRGLDVSLLIQSEQRSILDVVRERCSAVVLETISKAK